MVQGFVPEHVRDWPRMIGAVNKRIDDTRAIAVDMAAAERF